MLSRLSLRGGGLEPPRVPPSISYTHGPLPPRYRSTSVFEVTLALGLFIHLSLLGASSSNHY